MDLRKLDPPVAQAPEHRASTFRTQIERQVVHRFT